KINDHDTSIVIYSAIRKKKCIQLKLGYNNITCEGIEILSDALNNNITLEMLNLFNNKISNQGVYYLTLILSLNNSNLKVFFLGENQITDTGLSTNKISSQGVIFLANILAHHNTTLQELHSWGNKLIDETYIDSLANMLVYNQTLNKLVLFDCNISNTSKKRLRDVVEPKKNFGLFL
ncbi:unnamed protein product, partial [Rotaria sp. Silwood1]